MRNSHRLFLFGLVLLFTRPALAAPEGASPPPLITVVIESGDTLSAVCIEPAGIGTVRITEPDGRYQFRSSSRIRRVFDQAGRDRTHDALDRRLAIGAVPSSGYLEPIPAPPRPVRFGPRSVTRSFMITETSAFTSPGNENSRHDRRSFTFSFDFGHAFNVSDHDALGASIFVGGGDGSGDLGVRARYRRWLSTTSSLELAPGVILAHEEPGTATGKGVGFVGQIAWTYARWVSLAAQVYSVERSEVRYYRSIGPDSFGSYIDRGGRDTGLMLGVKVGGRPGIFAGAAGSMVALFTVRSDKTLYVTSPLR
jgi:hypothetical protein